MMTKKMNLSITVGICLLFVLTSIASAQTWTLMREGQFKTTFTDVVFVDANNGWAIGGGGDFRGHGTPGTIIHTSDGGLTWEEQINPVGFALYGVDFVNENVGWAVGDTQDDTPTYGILHTSDGGATWEQQINPSNRRLYDVAFVNENDGWAVGQEGTILHTSDSGVTWEQQNSPTNNWLYGVAFVNEYLGWAVDDGGVILHTEDSGSTWEQQTNPTGIWLGSVIFVNETTGWSVGGVVLHTTDGGETWEVQGEEIVAAAGAQDVDFINESVGWVVSGNHLDNTNIWHTLDGGATWEPTKIDTIPGGIDFVDENSGWIAGSAGTILYTSNGGETWELQTNPGFFLYDVAFVNTNEGWAVGQPDAILHTSDGGETWNAQETPLTSGYQAVTFVNANEGWVVGECGAIMHTLDGGTTWENRRTDCWGLRDVTFVNESLGWIVSHVILHTSNGGETWESQNNPSGKTLHGVVFVNENLGWAVGDDGTIIHTSNGGDTWEIQNSPTNQRLNSVAFVDESLGWAVGDAGVILHTSDGGATWNLQYYIHHDISLYDVVFMDENRGWTVGGGSMSLIYHTSNGGKTWKMQGSPTRDMLCGVAFVNGSSGWAVGTWGTILKHTPFGDVTLGDVSGDGIISAYDAALILQFVVGLIDELPALRIGAPDGNSTQRNYTVSILQLSARTGDKIHIPLIINDATGLFAGGISVKYDPTVLKAIDVAPLTVISGSYWKGNTDLNGEVRFAFATIEPPKGGGNLLEITFEVLPNTEGQISPLTLSNISLKDSLTIAVNNGAVTVLPSRTALLPNFPNPFNPETWIPYQLAETVPVTIRIFDQRGRIIRALNFGNQQAGSYATKDNAVYWDGKNDCGEKISSGVYFYQLQAGNFSATRKMTIIK